MKNKILGFDFNGSISQEDMDKFLSIMEEALNSNPVRSIVMDSADFIGLPTWNLGETDFPTILDMGFSSANTFLTISELDKERFALTDEDEVKFVVSILATNNVKTIDDFLAIHDAKFEDNYHMNHVRRALRKRLEMYVPKVPKQCNCGAKHTSFPNHHYNWCSANGK